MTEFNLTTEEAYALRLIIEELHRAKAKWPDWVNDPIHAAGVLVEEAGETMQAALDLTYSDGGLEDMAVEAAQTGAMAIRLIANLSNTEPHKHFQGVKAE